MPCNIQVADQQAIDQKLKLFFKEYKDKLQLPDFDNISDLPRIIKVPGVWSLKGTPTEERPHRQAKLIQLGETSKIQEVSDYILSLQPTAEEPKNNKITAEHTATVTINPVKLMKLRPCFVAFISSPGRNRVSSIDNRNEETGMRKALVREMYVSGGFNKDEILEVCQKFDDYNYDKSESEVKSELNAITAKKAKTWKCKSIHKNGGCLGETCRFYKRKITNVGTTEREEDKGETPTFESFCVPNENGTYEFKPALVARWLKDNEHFKIDRESGIFYYGSETKGKWDTRGEVHLQELLSVILGENNRASHYTNILHDLKGLTYEDVVFSKKIAMENGSLDVETLELTPFTLGEMTLYSVPVTYNPNIDKKYLANWLEFLKQVASPEDLATLQEWFGHVFLADYRFHRVLWIHGEGRNGKGVFDRTIQGLVGKENFSSVGLEELDGNHRFSLCQLYGKLYNSSSEPTTHKVFRTEIFQKVSGGDSIKAERKGKDDRVEFTNCAKLTIIGNKFPEIDSPTTAFKDRMMFIKFPNYFGVKERKPNLEKTWLDYENQRSAIFNWAMEGLQRLLKQGYFTESKTQRETEIEFQRVTDNVGAFQKEKGIIDKNRVSSRAEALDAYYEYCEDIGVEPVSKSRFTQAMQKLAPRVKDGWAKTAGKNERVWLGFGLKNLNVLDLDQPPQLPQQPQQKTLSDIGTESLNNIERENSVVNVATVAKSQVTVVQESSGVRQLEAQPYFNNCYFCQKPIYEPDAITDDFTEHKPAHKECYDKNKAQLKPTERGQSADYPEPGSEY